MGRSFVHGIALCLYSVVVSIVGFVHCYVFKRRLAYAVSRRSKNVLLAATLASVCQASQLLAADSSIDSPSKSLRVGAFNIEWLGFPDKRTSFGKDTPQKPEIVAKYIAQCKVDILSIEEIGVDSLSTPYRSKEFQSILDALKKEHKQSWEYRLFAKTDYPKGTEEWITRGQHIGVAWRTDKVTLIDEPYPIDVGSNSTYGQKFFERRAHAMKFSAGSGKTDIVVIPVHLKSNRADDKQTDPNYTAKQRRAELEAFVGKFDQLKSHFRDQDVILLGDTNIMSNEKTAEVLSAVGFVDLNASDEGTTVSWGKSKYPSAPFDRAFVPKSQPEFTESKQTIHKPDDVELMKDHRRQLSDHYLISFEIVVMDDDDS